MNRKITCTIKFNLFCFCQEIVDNSNKQKIKEENTMIHRKISYQAGLICFTMLFVPKQ